MRRNKKISSEQKTLKIIRNLIREELKPIIERLEKLEQRKSVPFPVSPASVTYVPIGPQYPTTTGGIPAYIQVPTTTATPTWIWYC